MQSKTDTAVECMNRSCAYQHRESERNRVPGPAQEHAFPIYTLTCPKCGERRYRHI